MVHSNLRLDHLNLPARDPIALARWYSSTFDLLLDEHRARGEGMLLVFVPGEPITREHDFHVGFRVPSNDALSQWARKFDVEVRTGAEFNTFRTYDPEGNCIEIYCKKDS